MHVFCGALTELALLRSEIPSFLQSLCWQSSEISAGSERAMLWGLLNPESHPLGEAARPATVGEVCRCCHTPQHRPRLPHTYYFIIIRCFSTAGINGRKRSVIWANAFGTSTWHKLLQRTSKWQLGTHAHVKPTLMKLSWKVLCLEQK